MAVWLVRAGKYGEREGFALERKVATIGWSLIPDLTLYDSRQAVRAILEERYPSEAAGAFDSKPRARRSREATASDSPFRTARNSRLRRAATATTLCPSIPASSGPTSSA
jgi:hypothetical protein